MNLEFSESDQGFRAEVRQFIETHLDPTLSRAQALSTTVFTDPEVQRPWHRALYERGWIAPTWPVEHGGPGWTSTQRYIFEDECARAGAPVIAGSGIRMVGPVIIKYGTEEQKRRYLPRILSGEDYWCQGYSEPGAGSDLSSLRTRAVRNGDHYVVDGSKIWTSHAQHANRMFALVRTADTGRKQEGISFLLMDMDAPGLVVRPIPSIGGEHEVNEVFFDAVRVPTANLIGEEGQGWAIGKYLLELERGSAPKAGRLRRVLTIVGDVVRQRDETDPQLAAQLTQIAVDIDTLEMIELRVLSALASGQSPGSMSSLLKLRASQLEQDVARAGLTALGREVLAWEPQRPFHKLDCDLSVAFDSRYLNSLACTIFGGSAEIQHEILARTLCGLD